VPTFIEMLKSLFVGKTQIWSKRQNWH